jgi:hypothetical protein
MHRVLPSYFLLSTAVRTAWTFLKPRDDALIVEDVLAVEKTDDFSFDEGFEADCAFFVTFTDLHFLYAL